MMAKAISKPVALLLVFTAQAALFGLLARLIYERSVDERNIAAVVNAAPGLGDKARILTAPFPDWTATAVANIKLEEVLAGWRSDLLGLAAALALTTTALVVLVLRIYRQQAVTSESEQRFRSLIEESVDGVVIHRDGIVLFANDAMAQILGLDSNDELTGRSLFRYIPRRPHPQTGQVWWTLTAVGQQLKRSRWQGFTAAGRGIHLDILSQPVDWRGVPAIRATVNDVTDQVVLAERERRQSAILSAVNDAHSIYLNEARAGMFFGQLLSKILQITGCEHGVIAEKTSDEEGNATVHVLASWTAERDSGEAGLGDHGLGGFLGDAMRKGTMTILNRMPRSRAAAEDGGPDGSAAMHNLLLMPLKLENNVLGEIALANRDGGFDQDLAEELSPIVQAITRIVADCRSTRLREAAEQASKLKSVFLAHMNHELRTPLSGVIASLELLRDTGLSDKQRELVDASMSAGKGLLGVIGNTLDLSKIEAEKLTLDPAEFDLIEMVESIKSIYLAAAQEKRIDLTTAVAANVPTRVVADEMRLRQVLSNLVSNSIKFTVKGRICLSLQAGQTGAGTARLHFAVDDTGIGFEPEMAGLLFKPFHQANQSISRDFGGTGLGLAIAHQLVTLHGGEISCDAEPRLGCSFMVSLPVTVADWNPPPAAALNGQALVILAPQSPPPAEVLNDLQAAGADLRVIDNPEAAVLPGPAGEAPQTLVIDWACAAEEAEGLLARLGDRYERVLAVAPRGDARRRRRWLNAGNVDLLAAPLNSLELTAALGATSREIAAPKQTAKDDFMAGVHTFGPEKAPRLLVVEDQPINQMVLQRQLERLGIDCDLADNGQEALDQLARESYDIIITDCAMPVMDGLELTRRIRALEAAGRPRSKIIALTANAITGSAQVCYEAGVDIYLSKPLKMAKLSSALLQSQTAESTTTVNHSAPDAKVAAPDDVQPPIDRAALAEILGQDDPALIDQVIRDFFYAWQDSFSALQHLLARRDAAGLADAAHAAKGTAHYGTAELLAADCAHLEQLARTENWADCALFVESLKRETQRLQIHLSKMGVIGYEQLRSA